MLCERGGQQARQNLLHAGPQLDVEELPPGAGLREAARPARVHHTLWKTGQDLVQVICSWGTSAVHDAAMYFHKHVSHFSFTGILRLEKLPLTHAHTHRFQCAVSCDTPLPQGGAVVFHTESSHEQIQFRGTRLLCNRLATNNDHQKLAIHNFVLLRHPLAWSSTVSPPAVHSMCGGAHGKMLMTASHINKRTCKYNGQRRESAIS